MNKKKSLVHAITLALGTAGASGAATAGSLVLTFTNNAAATHPFNTKLGFAAGSEFHLVTVEGLHTSVGDKDVMYGGETWTFSGGHGGPRGAQLTATNLGLNNSGGGPSDSNPLTLTTGVAGFPVGSTPNTVEGLQQTTFFWNHLDPLDPNNGLSVSAPLTGNVVGQTFGAAQVTDWNPGAGGVFEINFPVAFFQAVGEDFLLGADPNPNPPVDSSDPFSRLHSGINNGDKCAAFGPCGGPGVTFHGVTDGAGNFSLSASRRMAMDEASVNSSFNQIFEWSLTGTYAYSVVPLPASAWLFGSGVLGLAGLARRRRGADAAGRTGWRQKRRQF